MRDMRNDLQLAHHLADAADALCRRSFGAGVPNMPKADGSAVSAVDIEIEQAVAKLLQEHRPNDLLYGEELSVGEAPLAAKAVWIIDPIDHTRHFVRANPNYGVLIALMVEGVAEVALVSAPSMGHRWSALRGDGASLDGVRLRTSITTDIKRTHLALAGHREWVDRYDWRSVSKLMDDVEYLRGTAGGFYPAMQVAAGQLDAFAEPWGATWDHAALALIVEEAGGRASTLRGAVPTGGSLLVSNRLLHDELLGYFTNASCSMGDAS